ncbi:MAG: YbaK/EbsC family protein [Spirochaetaceae bacterium]|nr:YbaK/EbsC family protein [Spirochaetaceae bacterium]HPG26472.1 YbaK/EbsC family protein [Myxococcota bacterium]
MVIARRLERFLGAVGVEYECLPHPDSGCSAETARRSRVPLHRLIKPVLLEDEQGFVLALVSAAQRVDLDRLGRQLGRRLGLASEASIAALFDDCERGAVPPLGLAYRVPTIYDRGLSGLPEVYFEAGDHDEVVHMSGEAFCETLVGAESGRFGRPIGERRSGRRSRRAALEGERGGRAMERVEVWTRGFGMGAGAIGELDGFEQAESTLRRVIGGGRGGDTAWWSSFERSIVALGRAVEDHVLETESSDGLLGEIVQRAPRLRDRVDRLRLEHREMRDRCAALRGRLRDGASPDVLRADAQALLERCDRHLHRSADLIFASFGVDLGGE